MEKQTNPSTVRGQHRPPSAFRAGQERSDGTGPAPDGIEMGANGLPTVSGSRDFEDFVYILSHDVRGSVRALAELPTWIREDLTEGEIKVDTAVLENLDLMENHARRLDQMLLDLLVYSRVGRKQVMRAVHLDIVLSNVFLALNIPAKFIVTSDLGIKTLNMGEDDIETMLTALVSNAVKHHDKSAGKIHISTWSDQGKCFVQIADDGPGVPEKDRLRMMEAMTTLRSRDEIEGSGMGLAIVRKIVDLYGGAFEWCAPDNATGTKIRISMPIKGS